MVKKTVKSSPVATALYYAGRSNYFRLTHLASGSTIDDYFSLHSRRKLSIGTGDTTHPGWLCTDIEPRRGQVYLDATKQFPLPDVSFDYVISEHVIEHLAHPDGFFMLKECYRILKPGGKIRIATPDLSRLLSLFQDAQNEEAKNYLREKVRANGWPQTAHPAAVVLNYELREWFHLFVYDSSSLRESLEQVGFRGVNMFPVGESDDPNLRGVEARPDSGLNGYETMVLQAVRP